MTIWEHESKHAIYFAHYFKKADLYGGRVPKWCLPEKCHDLRSDYLTEVELAYTAEKISLDAKLHSVDYPPDLQEEWRRRAEAAKRDYDRDVAEAGRIRAKLIDCIKSHGMPVPSIRWPM